MDQRVLTIAPIAAVVDTIHVGKEIVAKFDGCTSAIAVADTFVHMTSLEQTGTLTCVAIVAGALVSWSIAGYQVWRKRGKEPNDTRGDDRGSA
jgi:hypothetical protein